MKNGAEALFQEMLKIKVENVDLSKYYGMFGKASAERLQELEGEAYL